MEKTTETTYRALEILIFSPFSSKRERLEALVEWWRAERGRIECGSAQTDPYRQGQRDCDPDCLMCEMQVAESVNGSKVKLIRAFKAIMARDGEVQPLTLYLKAFKEHPYAWFPMPLNINDLLDDDTDDE